jgi:hypothetical protein
MKALEAAAWLILLVIIGAVLAGGYAVYRIISAAVTAVPSVAWLAVGGVALFAFTLVIVGGAIYIVKSLAARIKRIYAKDGLFPLVNLGNGLFYNGNELGAQSLKALASGRRPTAALAGRVIDAHYRAAVDALPEQVAALASPPLTVEDVTAVDPRTDPHWLLVGGTGSGKTSASYAILPALARRAPCQFIITEPGGVNWGDQATATDTQQIALVIQAVQREMERRMAILRSNDADHASDLDLPYLMLVAEETDTVLDDLRLTNREMRTATVIALRNIARMGRKAGVCLLAVSQSGTTDVFDAHVRKNLSNVILFRSEHTVAETWRVAGVRLSTLPAGTAYSVPHGALLSFPLTSRPRLPIWCDLPELAEPVSIAVPDWPGAPATPLLPRREPTPEDMALIRQVVNVSRSQNDAIAKLYGSKDGKTLAWVKMALEVPSITLTKE